jgi:hypothetical protein
LFEKSLTISGEKPMIKRTTISLHIDDINALKKLAKREHRPISAQIVHMMEFYKKNVKI